LDGLAGDRKGIDVHLVADLISLRSAIPEKTKETARMVVRKVVNELTRSP